eukprot:3493556-Amphidinium_carterae.3
MFPPQDDSHFLDLRALHECIWLDFRAGVNSNSQPKRLLVLKEADGEEFWYLDASCGNMRRAAPGELGTNGISEGLRVVTSSRTNT